MARLDGEMSPQEAAAALGCHERTLRRWCDLALDDEPCRLPRFAVRRDITGHLWIRKKTVEKMAAEAA